MQAGKFAQALALLVPKLQRDPTSIQALDRAATCYLQLGDNQTAAKLLEVLLENNPDLPQAWGKLAAVRATSGSKAEAAEAYRRALALQPGDIGLLAAFNQLQTFASGSSFAARLRAALEDVQMSREHRILAHFALGSIEDKAGNTAGAFDHYCRANGLTEEAYDAELMEARIEAQLASRWSGGNGEEDPESPRLLFVTGLPRSGTTLLEACLTQHSQVASIGESTALSKTASAVRQHIAVQHGDSGWWNWLGRLGTDDLLKFRNLFWQLAFDQGKPDKPVVVDKMPLNVFEMGLAQLLLPNARFLFLSRHPLDTGLSNFMMNFAYGNRFSQRLDWIGHMTRCVYRSALDYQAKLGKALRVQSYEELVTSPELQIRAILEHAGLAWEAGCLNPEQNARMVRTASLMQVRQAINTRGLGKWRRYEEHLQPLIDALGGEEWIRQWEQWDRNAAGTGQFDPCRKK
ncbi:sulfotransferase [Leisingera sp. JC11]|uniref:sulfotransferase n=1 Tax=Leisingera sp. JC11 TaxID=3042469 RepID=UPI003451C9F0